MSIKYIDELSFDIYIKKELINNIDFNNKEHLEKYLKKIFKILKDKYNINVEGLYNVNIYNDKYYGIIIHLENENLEYYDCFKNQVDMRIITVNTIFLYKVDDLPKNINKFDIIIKNNNIYLKIKDKLSKLEMMNLLENSILVYEK